MPVTPEEALEKSQARNGVLRKIQLNQAVDKIDSMLSAQFYKKDIEPAIYFKERDLDEDLANSIVEMYENVGWIVNASIIDAAPKGPPKLMWRIKFWARAKNP